MGHCPRASVQGETSAFCRNEPRRIDPNRVGCLETKASRGCMRSLVDRGCQKTMGFWRMLPAAIVCSSSGSRSVRDRSRVRRAGCLGRSFAFWRRRTTAGAAAADPRSRPIRAPECKRRRQHSCMGHAEPAQRVWQRLVAFRLSPSRFEPRRVGRTGSSGFHILGPDPVGARGSTPEQCSETGLADGAASAARQHLFHSPGRYRISDDGICSSRAVRCPSACRKFGSCTRGCATEPPRSAPRIGAFRALIRGASP